MDLMFSHYRLSGIQKTLKKNGLQLDEKLVMIGNLTQKGGYEQAQILLGNPEPPTVIIAGNDLMAFGAMSAAQERGMVVGKDISISGFDDIPMAEYAHPPLTTIHQPVYKIGGILCEMLIQSIHGVELDEREVVLEPTLMVRQSCGPAPG